MPIVNVLNVQGLLETLTTAGHNRKMQASSFVLKWSPAVSQYKATAGRSAGRFGPQNLAIYQQRNIPSNQIAKAMGANPFVVEKALQHTKNFSNQQLRRAYLQLTQADRSLKSTSQDPICVMQNLILGLTATGH